MAIDERTLTAGLDALEIPVAPKVSRGRRIWASAWPKLLAIAIFLGFWQFLIWIEWKPSFAFATPADTFSALYNNWDIIIDAMWTTLRRGFQGYAIAIVIGVALGAAVARIPVLRDGTWQLSTVQFDFTLPKRFDLSYIGPDGHQHQPVMLHRALLGSVERFMGVLIEHYAGAFPIWLAPVQAVVIPIAERHQEHGKQAYKMKVLNRPNVSVTVQLKPTEIQIQMRAGGYCAVKKKVEAKEDKNCSRSERN